MGSPLFSSTTSTYKGQTSPSDAATSGDTLLTDRGQHSSDWCLLIHCHIDTALSIPLAFSSACLLGWYKPSSHNAFLTHQIVECGAGVGLRDTRERKIFSLLDLSLIGVAEVYKNP